MRQCINKKENNMTMLQEKDIAILEYIINNLIEKNDLFSYKSFQSHSHFVEFKNEDKIKEFQRLIDILSKFNLIKIHLAGYYNSIQSNQNTLNFKQTGGFNKVYRDELIRIEKQQERETLENELAKSNLEANELNKSIASKNEIDKKKNRTERIINISIGVLNLILLVVQVLISLC